VRRGPIRYRDATCSPAAPRRGAPAPSMRAGGDSWFYPYPGGSLTRGLVDRLRPAGRRLLVPGNNGADTRDYVHGSYRAQVDDRLGRWGQHGRGPADQQRRQRLLRFQGAATSAGRRLQRYIERGALLSRRRWRPVGSRNIAERAWRPAFEGAGLFDAAIAVSSAAAGSRSARATVDGRDGFGRLGRWPAGGQEARSGRMAGNRSCPRR
jgi:hypothetical protein